MERKGKAVDEGGRWHRDLKEGGGKGRQMKRERKNDSVWTNG